MFAQFTLNTVSLAPPNNTIPIKLTGTALGKSSGVFTLGGSPHSMSYDSQTKLLELDLDQPNINAVNQATEAALGADGTHYTGWDTFQSTYALALGTHNRCVVWSPSAAVPKQSFHPSQYGDSWCTAIDKGVPVGTAYLQFNESVCTDQVCTNILRTYQSAIMNGAPIVTSDSFCYTPVSFDNGGTCFSRARGISGDDVVGDYNGTVGSPFDPATAGKSVGSALDSSPAANPLPHALLWHPSKSSVTELHPAGFAASIALATNGSQQGGWATDVAGNMHAMLWSGSAASAVDLSPAGYTDTRITGMSTLFQAGDGWVGGAANTPGAVHHGLVWQGSAAGVLDLNQFLPAGYPHLTITGVDADGNISGYMQQDFNGTPAANSEVGVLFTPTPSSSVVSLSLSPSIPAPGDTISGVVALGAPAAAGGVQITFTSSNGALLPPPAPIVIPEGQISATFTILVSATVFQPVAAPVTLTALSRFVARSAAVTVTPQAPADGIVSVSVTPASVAPGDSLAIQVSLAGPAPAAGVIVNFSSSNTAVLATPASVVVPAGQLGVTATVVTNSATLYQPVTVVLSAATGTVVQQASLSVASVPKPLGVFLGTVQNAILSTQGGTTGSGFVSLSAVATLPTTITLTNTNPALSVPPNVSVPAGQSFGNFGYSTVPVPVATAGTLTAAVNGGSASSTITITGSPSPSIQSFVIPVTSTTQTWSSGQALAGTVTLTGPAYLGGMTISLSADTPAAVILPASIMVPAGKTTASFTVTAAQVAAPTTVTITATLAGFAPIPVTLTIIPGPALAIASYTLNPYSMIGPGVVTNGTISLNQPAPAGGVVISLSVSPGAAKLPSSVTLAQGQTSASFTVQGNSVSGPTAVSLAASYKGVFAPLGTSAFANLTVAPTDTLKMPKPTWSSSTHVLTVTATSTNPQSIITVLNANGNVPLGTMTGDGAGNYSFQTTIASIASVNIKSNLGGSTGQGVTVVP